jgi:hypothetical protein
LFSPLLPPSPPSPSPPTPRPVPPLLSVAGQLFVMTPGEFVCLQDDVARATASSTKRLIAAVASGVSRPESTKGDPQAWLSSILQRTL